MLTKLGLYSSDSESSHLTTSKGNHYSFAISRGREYSFSAYHTLVNSVQGEADSAGVNYNELSTALISSAASDEYFILSSDHNLKKPYYLNMESLTSKLNHRYLVSSRRKFHTLVGLFRVIKKTISLLEKRLKKHNIEPTMERVISLWILTNHLSSDYSIVKHNQQTKDQKLDCKRIATQRMYELIAADIKPYLALQSLTKRANKSFSETGEFEWSVKNLKQLNDFPLVYLDKLLWDAD